MEAILLYEEFAGKAPVEVVSLAPSGSSRRYYRFVSDSGETMVGCEGDDIAENEAFIYLSRHFADCGLPVPTLFAVARDSSCYLMEDLGDVSLFDAIGVGRSCGIFPDDEIDLLKRTVSILPDFQFAGARGLDFSRCYPAEAMDRRMVMWDLNYFKYCFVKVAGLEVNEALLQDDFERMADDLLQDDCIGFMYRDFQSRNVLIDNGNPRFIDYQGGRRGPAYYDLASFVWQAKANLNESLRMALVDFYIESASRYIVIERDRFIRRLMQFVLFRSLQVLGAYGFRGYIQKKSHFIESIPYAMTNLRRLLSDGVVAPYSYLESVLLRLVELPQFIPEPAHTDLRVRVFSFSYKRGIPADYTGNGGGFVFDCRGLHNPGRYDQYKPLTGMDAPVITFLEDVGEVQGYLEHVYGLVGPTVERYKKRGFTELLIAFGCTGGRHRSVYCADHTARWINENYNVRVELNHRERGVTKTFSPI